MISGNKIYQIPIRENELKIKYNHVIINESSFSCHIEMAKKGIKVLFWLRYNRSK